MWRRKELGVAAATLVAAATVVAACAAGGGAPALTALPPCQDPPPAAADAAAVTGLVIPPQAVVTGVSGRDPLTNVAAYAALTPIEVRLWYEAAPHVEVLSSEDEVFEAELLLVAAGRRSFVRASAACDRGSHLLVVVAPDTEPGGTPVPLPEPSGSGQRDALDPVSEGRGRQRP